MDFSLITRTLNVGNILTVLCDDVIFNAISEDGFTKDDFKPNVFDEYWLEITINNKLAGVVQLKPIFKNCWDSHIHVLPGYREHSAAIGADILEWCRDNIEGTLYTTVPVSCQNVVMFLQRFDFDVSGKIPMAWTKNGKQEDLVILTRVL